MRIEFLGGENMNAISLQILAQANEAAIYNIYLYLAHKTTPADNETLWSVIVGLEAELKRQTKHKWKDRDIYRLTILKNAVINNSFLVNTKIGNLTRSKSGLTACSFANQNGEVFIAFKGTGSGEWIDNGEGLSGVPEPNTYITYSQNGNELFKTIIDKDYATEQQVEALNWFNKICAKNGWNNETKIILTGHSKGGNKAQFVTIHSDLAHYCYNFDGQGFSPEAIDDLKCRLGEKFEIRRQKILSFATDNDYVNVLGRRLMPDSNIYYFEAFLGLHYMEAMLDNNGRFNKQSEQGKLSLYVEKVSEQLMNMSPVIRRYATLGVMNIFQKYLGEGTPVNNDSVSIEETIAGLGIAIVSFLQIFKD